MLTAKESVFARFKQTFVLLMGNKKNFFNIFVPYFLYKFFVVMIIGNLLYFGITKVIDFDSFLSTGNQLDGSLGLLSNTNFIITINVLLVLWTINLTLLVAFLITTYKTIKDIFEEKEVLLMQNIKYGFKNIWNSFYTYWYIFAYVALTPLIILIIGGLFYIYGFYFKGGEYFYMIGSIFSVFGMILLAIYGIYRGLKTIFSLVSAIDYNEYTKHNFKQSIFITKGNLWRIIGNFLVFFVLVFLIFFIISLIIGFFKVSISSNNINYIDIFSGNIDINKVLGDMQSYFSNLGDFSFQNLLFDMLDLFLKVLETIIFYVFTFIFYKRLILEKKQEKKAILTKKEKNLKVEKQIIL